MLGSGCRSPAAPAPAIVSDPVAIRYAAHGCYGTCPVYNIVIRSDGIVDYVGRDHVLVSGARRLRVSPEQFQRFAAYLAPIKPERGSIPGPGVDCNVNDGPSWSIEWTGADGASQGLCVGSHKELPDPNLAHERIRKAPALLPLEGLVGPG